MNAYGTYMLHLGRLRLELHDNKLRGLLGAGVYRIQSGIRVGHNERVSYGQQGVIKHIQ